MGGALKFTEKPVAFDCRGERLHGILSVPASVAELGVVIVIGGPQYRAGSHRQFVLLARALANSGIAVLRFDVRGMGDSTGDLHTFEDITDDIGAAIDVLTAGEPGLKSVTLLGLCDAASAALLYVEARAADTRVRGLVLMNPWVRSAQTLAETHVKHYYVDRLRQPEFWRKMLKGGVTWKAIPEFLKSLSLALRSNKAEAGTNRRGFQARMADAMATTHASIWLVLSGQDYTAKEFIRTMNGDPQWHAARVRSDVHRLDLKDADHTFSSGRQMGLLEQWLADELNRPRP